MSSPRPVFRWLGAKWALAPWIIASMPPHITYVEPFGGSAAVLACKAPSTHEVLNDKDDALTSLYAILRDPFQLPRLLRLLALTPYSRTEFLKAYEPADDPIEAARRMLVRGAMAHGSDAITRGHRSGFKCSTKQRASDAAVWAALPDKLPAWLVRLRNVCIENDDALAVMQRHDSPHTLHYVDPPYPWATRRDGRAEAKRTGRPKHGYRHELDDEQHEALGHVLKGLKGMVMLSGYPCPLYERLYPHWHCLRTSTTDQANNKRVEGLWFNEAAWAARPETKAMWSEP